MNLLIDVGNTRLKWAYAEGDNLKITSSFFNTDLCFDLLELTWQALRPQKILLSCIGKADVVSCIAMVADKCWSNIVLHHIKTSSEGFGVINGYAEPEKLGVDRWLALIAVRTKTKKAVCVVDCGTAITIDLLNTQGVHQGGVICPGLTLMQKSLHDSANLPFFFNQRVTEDNLLANNTEEAICYGVLYAVCSLIERVMSEQTTPTQLILTGGDALLIAEKLRYSCRIEPHLVLEGLAIMSC